MIVAQNGDARLLADQQRPQRFAPAWDSFFLSRAPVNEAPGAKMLVIVGASHKAYFDAYLDQMQDWELVSVDAVLADSVQASQRALETLKAELETVRRREEMLLSREQEQNKELEHTPN